MNETLHATHQKKHRQPDIKGQLLVHLSFPTNDSPDNNWTPNKAEAKVVQDKLLQPNYWVQLKITDSTATFFDAGPDTGKQVTTLKTGTDGRIHAKFVNDVGGPGTMTATIVRGQNGDPIKNGPSDTEKFKFKATVVHDYKLGISIKKNDYPADSLSQNAVSAVLTDGSNPGTGTIVFRLEESKKASFVDTGDPNIAHISDKEIWVKTDTKGVAEAYFVDGNSLGEDVTVTASLQGVPGLKPSPSSLNFTFNIVDLGRELLLFPVSKAANADSKQRNNCLALLTEFLAPTDDTIVFTLPDDKSASFVDPKDSHTTFVSSKEIKVKTDNGFAYALFTDSDPDGETVILQARSKNAKPSKKPFIFNPAGTDPVYGVKLCSVPFVDQLTLIFAAVTRSVVSNEDVWVRFSIDDNPKVSLFPPERDKDAYKIISYQKVEAAISQNHKNLDFTYMVCALYAYDGGKMTDVLPVKVTAEVVGHEDQASDTETIFIIPLQGDSQPGDQN